jgi:hypothetical protein
MVYVQVMTLKTSNALCIPTVFRSFSQQFALVLLYQPGKKTRHNAHILHFISLGAGRAGSPICLAKFRPCKQDKQVVVDDAEIFSHLDKDGHPVHQPIEAARPTAKESAFKSKSGVSLEYGPDLKFGREPSDSEPVDLLEQLSHMATVTFTTHCCHAFRQWQEDVSVNGQYLLVKSQTTCV